MSETTTTRLGLTKPVPGSGEPVDLADHINGNLDKVDAAIGFAPVTSATRPVVPFDGQAIRETDTGRIFYHNGSSPASAGWVQMAAAGIDLGTSNWSTAGSGSFGFLQVSNGLSAGSLSTGGAEIRPIRALHARATAVLNLTATVTDVPGATLTFTTTYPNTAYVAIWAANFNGIAAGTPTGIVQLNIDGSDLTAPELVWNQANVAAGSQTTGGTSYVGVLASAGSHTFKLRGSRSGGADSQIRVNAAHTQLTLLIFG